MSKPAGILWNSMGLCDEEIQKPFCEFFDLPYPLVGNHCYGKDSEGQRCANALLQPELYELGLKFQSLLLNGGNVMDFFSGIVLRASLCTNHMTPEHIIRLYEEYKPSLSQLDVKLRAVRAVRQFSVSLNGPEAPTHGMPGLE